jgi:hypothetical protein
MTKSIRYSKFKNGAIFSHTGQQIEGRNVKDSIPRKFEVLKSGKILIINNKSYHFVLLWDSIPEQFP